MRSLLLPLFAAGAAVSGPALAQNQSNVTYNCDRACLTGVIDDYLDALVANDASAAPLAPGARVTLNGDLAPLADGFWDAATGVQARIDIANPRWGDTGTQAVINNEDGSQVLYTFRLKVKDGAITEVEQIRIRNAEEGSLFNTEPLQEANPNFNTPIRPAEQDSYYALVAAAESYWRAFNTNGTEDYHPAEFWPGVNRLENGVQTTNVEFGQNGVTTAAEQFDVGMHAGRNIWDLRYPVVDEEYGVVMSIARFGLKDGFVPTREAQKVNRLVAEFFAIKKGQIHDIQAVMVNRPDAEPTGWEADYGPAPGGWPEVTCDRECLTGYVDAYYAALTANDASALPQASGARITLNGEVVDLADAFWDGAEDVRWRFDIVNEHLGDTGAEVVVTNADGSETMEVVRLKVADGAITEMEIVRANEGDAGVLWGPDQLDPEPSSFLTLPIRTAEQDSYYDLIAAAESYWRAFQTNGFPDYHRADLLFDAQRFENGFHTTGVIRNGEYASAAAGFDRGAFAARNLWDRRYAVVDPERGIVLSFVRFGQKDGVTNESAVTADDRLVAEFFSVKSGRIQEVHAVLFNRDDDEPTGWDTDWYGPGKGGWDAMPTGQ